jgi:hypothetical protein
MCVCVCVCVPTSAARKDRERIAYSYNTSLRPEVILLLLQHSRDGGRRPDGKSSNTHTHEQIDVWID